MCRMLMKEDTFPFRELRHCSGKTMACSLSSSGATDGCWLESSSRWHQTSGVVARSEDDLGACRCLPNLARSSAVSI